MISAISNTAVVALWLSSAALAAVGVAAQDPPFTKEDMGCEYNPADGSACPRRYRISGGPGYTGERATWEHVASRETNMFCSPSCVEGGTANGECSLILAFHGIYSNPSDQHWLMMGHGAPEITYDESEASGGPFCISFHKAKGVAWDYTCNGDDAAHIEGFIHWALDEFPTLDPAAVNLHGFSSGGIQTMHLMDTRCPIEKLIAAAAPYGGGHMESPPTTKAAFLLAHGTHDNVVFYGEGWNEVTGTAVPTCARTDAGFFNNFQEFQNTWVQLFGEAITAGVAKYRGYTGDVYGPLPAKSGSIDLIDEAGRWNDKTCEAVKADCVIQNYAPSPFNDNFDCATLPAEETDIIDYPVSAGSKPVQLLKINIHNHDYPNRRRNGGPTEFFLYLRKFFNQNRGTRAPKQNQTVQDVGAEVCTDPDSFGEGLSFAYRRKVWDSSEPGGLTPEKCAELCKEDEECVEVFYIDYQPHYFDKACHLHYRFLPCTSTKSHSGPTSMHYVTSDAPMNPTKTPTPKPTPNPNSTPNPTPDPTPDPLSLCTQGGVLVPTNFGGYSCLEGLGDSNSGMTEEECNSLGGTWVSYNCQDADSYWKSVGGSAWEYAYIFGPAWEEKCCSTATPPPTKEPTPSPTNEPTPSPSTKEPTPSPTKDPTPSPTNEPTPSPTNEPTLSPTNEPTPAPTGDPARTPTKLPTPAPTKEPTTPSPTKEPTPPPTNDPTPAPTNEPTTPPTNDPTPPPTNYPTPSPTNYPTPPPIPLALCPVSTTLLGPYFAGYSCLDGLGDSNSGTTEEECNSLGGTWVPYNCQDADSFWKSVGGSSWEHGGFFGPEWERQCCSSEGVLSSTTDIGSVGIPGATTFNSDSLTTTLYASGADIWGTNDAFRFAYQTLDLDGSIYALVHPPSLSSDWEKSGLMIRQSLAANSAHASVFVTGANGVLSQYRPSTSAQSTGTHVDWYDRTTPIWLAIKRKQGRYISFWRSEDAVNWTQVGYTIDIPMGNTIHVGIAATAHNNNAIVEGKTQYFGIA